MKTQSILAVALFSSLLVGSFLLSSCASAPKQESTGQIIDSSAITVKVKSRLLMDKSVKSLAITVNTYGNVVQLSGFVDNQQQKDRAVLIAKNVKGVESVRDDLVIK